ncbi:ABC transporter ATP-binding protein [Dissulfurirhabdus thermomarina]|uniref:ABC transporter ATP-binding protein n=1 Tax=Dissulfurirhabdus thermomarina TaxID=1765737 RepID=A0A6N9TNA3_DISTH|nr:ABC transporter ATP-binding protein [Dissulfurirhabdus thermomarina]NDY42782.1 ABC transporter ATP-binding protein [Dissulfurirhabdus thermomarina]NMX23554.1 ABC transporter ATP-binding protein [Dissulfurirhabdus thermomarina]
MSGLAKSFVADGHELEVLRGLSFTIHPGEAVGVVGASGVGKTTLLHILGTLEQPTAGEVRHFGEDVFAWDDTRLSRFRNRRIGFVFQFHHLLPEFTAVENVMMPGLIAGLPRAEIRRRAEAVLAAMGLAGRMDHRVGRLSGGEQQRVALARAVVLEPPLLLADEPTGNLDERTGRQVEDLLFALNRDRGVTLVVVTHNLSFARRMDRCLGLTEGRAVELAPGELAAFGVGRAEGA